MNQHGTLEGKTSLTMQTGIQTFSCVDFYMALLLMVKLEKFSALLTLVFQIGMGPLVFEKSVRGLHNSCTMFTLERLIQMFHSIMLSEVALHFKFAHISDTCVASCEKSF